MKRGRMQQRESDKPPRDIVELRYLVGVERSLCCYEAGRVFLMPSFCMRDRRVLG